MTKSIFLAIYWPQFSVILTAYLATVLRGDIHFQVPMQSVNLTFVGGQYNSRSKIQDPKIREI